MVFDRFRWCRISTATSIATIGLATKDLQLSALCPLLRPYGVNHGADLVAPRQDRVPDRLRTLMLMEII